MLAGGVGPRRCGEWDAARRPEKLGISMIYPRPIRSIHQIEVTTHCNLRCIHCPHPIQAQLRHQEPRHMDRKTFERAIEWAAALNDPTDPMREELSLTGI